MCEEFVSTAKGLDSLESFIPTLISVANPAQE